MGGGVAVVATVVYDWYLLRAEQAAVEAGAIAQAADLASRVRLLKLPLAAKLREQLPAVAASDRRFPRELPLVEALLAIAPDPELAARRAALRVLVAGPEAIAVREATLQLGGPVAAPGAGPAGMPSPVTAERAEVALKGKHLPIPPVTPWGAPFVLTRRNAGGAVIPMGDGVAGRLGRSWDVSPDGRHAVFARPAERMLERWDLAANRWEMLPAAGSPAFVALPPVGGAKAGGAKPGAAQAGAPDGVAYSTPRSTEVFDVRSEVLHLWRKGTSRQLFPAGDQRIGALSFEWAPDGGSLLVRWHDRPVRAPGEVQHLAWVAPDGRELMAVVVDGWRNTVATWSPGPGARMGLVAAGTAWAWDGREPSARLLPGVRGAWGWSPDGRLIAGIDVGHVFVAMAADPKRRMDHKVEGLPPYFALDPAGFDWTADGLHLAGRAAAHERGPWRRATLAVRLEAIDP